MTNEVCNEKFTLDDSMAAGWTLLREHFWKFLQLLGLAGFICFIPDVGTHAMAWNADVIGVSALLTLAGMFLKGLMALGVINIQIRIFDGQPVSSDDLWAPAGKFWAFAGATILYLLAIGIGAFFFIIPGIIFGIMFQFYPYFLVEHRLGPIQALKASAAITSGVMWELFFLNLILGILEGAGTLFFLIGWVPAHMFNKLTITHAYKTLLDRAPVESLPFTYVKRPGINPAVDVPRHEPTEQIAIGSVSDAQAQSSLMEEGGNRISVGKEQVEETIDAQPIEKPDVQHQKADQENGSEQTKNERNRR